MFLQPFVPDSTMYLIAILGLLAVWQYYRMQVMAGRILEGAPEIRTVW